MSKTPEFIHKKHPDLPGSKPVEKAVQKARREGVPVPDKKESRLLAYFKRLEDVVEDKKGWDLLKKKISKDLTIDVSDQENVEKIADALYESEKRIAMEQGRGGDIAKLEDRPDLIRKYQEMVGEKQVTQEKTLEPWLDYLRQNDARYPMWFRYYVVRSLGKMGALDKGKLEYVKRTKETIAPFPELNAEALGWAYRMLSSGIGHNEYQREEDQDKKKQILSLIQKGDFPNLYALGQSETAGELDKESLEGEWVKYPQGSDHQILEKSLEKKNTGWCTASGSAYSQLQQGDFYVYYTRGPLGNYTEPRVAIRMDGGRVAEVRGVNKDQELEPELLEIAQKQYQALPGGEKYDKKSADMKYLTQLVKKHEKGGAFTKEDLTFLYEMDGKIEGFGYKRDPRIEELLRKRNPNDDMLVIFECASDEIAHNPNEIYEGTRAYVGELYPGIFKTIQKYDIEYIYTSFPEGRIRFEDLEIGGKNVEDLEKELQNKKNDVSSHFKDVFRSKDFTTLKNPEAIQLVHLTVSGLFSDNKTHTIKEIYQKAEELGLELCPAEVGPHLRLKYQDQPLYERIRIAMKPISDRYGGLRLFKLERDASGLFLDGSWVDPTTWWNSGSAFVFVVPPAKSAEAASEVSK